MQPRSMFNGLWFLLVSEAKSEFFPYCSFPTSALEISIILALFNYDGTGMVLAGLGMAPKTKSTGHRPFDLTVQLTAKTVRCRNSLSLVRRSLLGRTRRCSNCRAEWYILTTQIALGVSIGASSCLTLKASKVSFTFFDV